MSTQNTTPDATATPECDELVSEGRAHYMSLALARSLEKRLTAAKAALRERTQWQCACGGTDCAGRAENERLRADLKQMGTVAAERLEWHTQSRREADQLRARVADLESQLSASATKAAAEYGEQLKPLFAKVRELEQENTRLTQLLRNRLVEVQEQQQGGITT